MDNNVIIEGMKTTAEYSKQLQTWALTLFGASVLAIVSTSYVKPIGRKVRLIYLIYPVGWCFIAQSMYWGNQLQRGVLGALFLEDHNIILDNQKYVNTAFRKEQFHFSYALIAFSVWLLAYLVWWIFFESTARPEIPSSLAKKYNQHEKIIIERTVSYNNEEL